MPSPPSVSADAPDFRALFQRPVEAVGEAPGRVNLMGDHTDYNGGCVLPTVMPQRTRVEVAMRDDRTVRAWTTAVSGEGALREYTVGSEARRGGWIDYVQGATQVLRSDGQPVRGFDARFESDVPLGAGLASSASMVIALVRALREAVPLALSDIELAMVAHRTETSFVGAPIGVMDQMICALGKPGEALFLDTATLDREAVPLPPALEFIVIHSGVSHHHASGGYRVRRAECEEAASRLRVARLRDLEGLPSAQLAQALAGLPPPLGRRARHVVRETQRVGEAVSALKAVDLVAFGRLMYESHESLRADYEVSVDETDLLVNLARQEPHIYGARITGGGFGGSVVMAAQSGTAEDAVSRIAATYAAKTRHSPIILLPRGATERGREHPRQGGST